MATQKIDEQRLTAGAAYLTSLKSLCLDPEGLFWAWDVRENSWVLVLVSSFFDSAGPTELSRLLFRAFDLAVTPKEISPFTLRLHSPKQRLIRDFATFLEHAKIRVRDLDEETGKWGPQYDAVDKADIGWGAPGDIEVPVNHIYQFRSSKPSQADLSRRWKFVTNKLEQLAA